MDTVALAAAESTEIGELVTNVVLGDGFAPLLVLAGGIIILVSMAVFGALTLGAVASLFRFD